MSTLAIIFSAAGGLCEFVGLVLVIFEIREDRLRAARLFGPRRRPTVRQRRYPGRVMAPGPNPFGSLTSSARQQTDTEAMGKIAALLANALINMRKAVDAELDRTSQRLQDEFESSDSALREQLLYVLGGGIRTRIVGAILLGLGITFGTTGSILSSLAH
jgi:hypothetical protein